MKKILSVVLAVIMLLGMTSVMAEGESMTTWYTFNDVYLSSVRDALDKAYETYGVKNSNQDANNSQATQLDQVNTAAINKQALVVNLVESGSDGTAQNILDVAKRENLPVVFFNRAIAQDDETAKAIITSYDKAVFVGTKYEEAGIMQGKLIGDYVLENFEKLDLNGDGFISYVMLKGDETNLEAIARTKYGVEEADKVLVAAGKNALKFYDDSNANKYLVDQQGAWSGLHGNETIKNILSQYNEENKNMVELVIANNDDMAIGAINALTEAGYNTGAEGAKVIPVFGVDATELAVSMIEQGRMTGTIKQDAVGMADAVANVVANFLNGKTAFEGLNKAYVQEDGWKLTIPYSIVK